MDEQSEVPETEQGSGGFDRRKLLQGAAMAGAAAWVVPSVISLTASPAMASGLIFDAKTQSSNVFTVSEVDYSPVNLQWQLQGVVVVTIAINSFSQVITPPDSDWQVVYSDGTSSGTKLMAATFVRNYAAVPSHGAFPWKFTWPTAATMTSGFTSFANATTVQDVSATPTLTTSTSVTAGTVTVTADNGVPQDFRQLIWTGAWATVGAGLTGPPALPLATQFLSAAVSNAQTGIGQYYGSFEAPNPQTACPTPRPRCLRLGRTWPPCSSSTDPASTVRRRVAPASAVRGSLRAVGLAAGRGGPRTQEWADRSIAIPDESQLGSGFVASTRAQLGSRGAPYRYGVSERG